MAHQAADPSAMSTIVDILCGVDRPKASTPGNVPEGSGRARGPGLRPDPLTDDGLDSLGRGKRISHLRNMLEHHCLLPPRDEHLARFESWLAAKLEAIPRRAVRDKGWTKVVLHPAKV